MNKNQTVSEYILEIKKGNDQLIIDAAKEYINNLEMQEAIDLEKELETSDFKMIFHKHMGILSLLFMFIPYGSEEDNNNLIESIMNENYEDNHFIDSLYDFYLKQASIIIREGNEESNFEYLTEEQIINTEKTIISTVEKWKLHHKLLNELKINKNREEKFKI